MQMSTLKGTFKIDLIWLMPECECSIIVFKPKITSFYQLRIFWVGDSRYTTQMVGASFLKIILTEW
jgi:hypothetical protein